MPTVYSSSFSFVAGINTSGSYACNDINVKTADVFTTFAQWLQSHPTETLIVRLRRVQSTDYGSNYAKNLKSAITDNIPSANRIDELSSDITLGDVRGKVLVIATTDYNDGWVGACAQMGWSNTASSKLYSGTRSSSLTGSVEVGTVTYTDMYQYSDGTSSFNISHPNESDKKSAISSVLSSAKNNSTTTNWYWTWLDIEGGDYQTSYYDSKITGRKTATYNSYAIDIISNYGVDQYQSCGMVMMDWVGYDNDSYKGTACKNAVIANNFRAVLSNGLWPSGK